MKKKQWINASNDDLLEISGDALRNIEIAMEYLNGYYEFADMFAALEDIAAELSDMHQEYTEEAEREDAAELDEMTGAYWRAVL